MHLEYLKQYDKFIETYERIFHLNSNEQLEVIFNLFESIIINKYKTRILELIKSLFIAIKYNYRSIELYVNVINQFVSKYSFDLGHLKYLILRSDHLRIFTNSENVNQINIIIGSIPRENSIEEIIMYDKIDKFKEYVVQNSFEYIRIKIYGFFRLNAIESCCYFGSVNIFQFIISCLNQEITSDCLEYSFIGGNTDIINECLKKFTIDSECMNNIISSHNNKFLEYVFERNLFRLEEIEYQNIIDSQNLKAVFLMFKEDKNSIIPWCAAFPETIEILVNEKVDLFKTSSDKEALLHFSAAFNTIYICKFLLNSSDFFQKVNSIKDDLGRIALHHASMGNSVEVAKVLLFFGANVNAHDKYGETPLHFAANYNNKEMAELLIHSAAKINLKNKLKRTCLHEAA